ncbi:ComF family protein [Streptococcaceae bacterium ESL0729]|nr:ComF family protein [Streptococcaceae bacterium ESL0729]
MKESSEDICRDCSYWATSSGILVQHEALYRYNQAMRDFFVAYKLQGDYRLRLVFANSLKRALTNYKGYTVVPVPVSSKRLEERGFCQVTSILEAARIPYLNLFKKDESDSQKLRNRKERLLAENPFSLEEGLDCPKKILIFDDIYTSGRTITHLMELLNGLGKFEIKSLSIAR